MIRTFALCLGFWLIQPPEAPNDTEAGAPTLYYGGRIHLGDDRGAVVEALLVRDGVIEAVGKLDDLVLAQGEETWTRVDLDGANIVPGLQDAHVHLEAMGAALEDELALDEATDEADMIRRVVEHAGQLEPRTWIVARGFDHNGWSEGRLPDGAALTEAIPEHPVILIHADGHAAVCNRLALAAAGIEPDRALPRVPGGTIVVDADQKPTGLVLDRAVGHVTAVVPPLSPEARLRRLIKVQNKLISQGLTAVHAMGVRRNTLADLAELRQSGRLAIRVVAYLDASCLTDRDPPWQIPPRDTGDVLTVAGVFFDLDGTFATRTAALVDDYADAPKSKGRLLYDEAALAEQVLLAVKAGLQPAISAHGDRANRTALNVLESLARAMPELRRLRPRIEHARLVSAKDWPRFPTLMIVPSMQPASNRMELEALVRCLGPERVAALRSWKRLAPGLGRLAFGSAAPMGSSDPLCGLRAARVPDVQVPGQLDTLADDALDGGAALSGYTSGPAYAGRQEARRGRLLPGYAADLTVLDVDPTLAEPEDLSEARVRMVVINGRVVHRGER